VRARAFCGLGRRWTLRLQCPGHRRPTLRGVRDGALVQGHFSQGVQTGPKTWQFDSSDQHLACVVVEQAGCQVQRLRRRLNARAFQRLERRGGDVQTVARQLDRGAPFTSRQQRWLRGDEHASGRWVDRYRLLRPAPRAPWLRERVAPEAATPVVPLPSGAGWLDKRAGRRWWRARQPRFTIQGPARFDVVVRSVNPARRQCISVDGQRRCRPDAADHLWRNVAGQIARSPLELRGDPLGLPLRWRVLLPAGEHRIQVDIAEALVRATRHVFAGDFHDRAGTTQRVLIYPPSRAPRRVRPRRKMVAVKPRAPAAAVHSV